MNGGLAVTFLFVFLFIWYLMLSFAAIGIVWSPFAAAIGALIAHRKGMDVRRAASVSTVYSVISPLLWLHYVLRMGGRAVSRKPLSFIYLYVFIVWITSMSLLWFSEFEAPGSYSFETEREGAFGTPAAVIVAALLTGALACFISLARKSTMSPVHDAPAYLPPFVFCAIWVFAPLIHIGTIERFDWVNWWLILPTAGSLLWIFWHSGPWFPQRVRTFFEGDLS